MLKYKGTGFLPGIPARDLSDEEVDMHGGEQYLLETGLYELPEGTKTSKLTVNKKSKTTLIVDEEKE